MEEKESVFMINVEFVGDVEVIERNQQDATKEEDISNLDLSLQYYGSGNTDGSVEKEEDGHGEKYQLVKGFKLFGIRIKPF